MNCRICNAIIQNTPINIKEKMFNTGESFEYVLCASCNCIQIKEIPVNIAKYYPQNYYSFSKTISSTVKKKIKQRIYNFFSLIKRDFYEKTGFDQFCIYYTDKKKEILDIGCGDGSRLKELHSRGFTKLTGTDPFLVKEYRKKGIKILKLNTEKIEGKFDIIMSHHSLEHMPNPHILFHKVKDLLYPDGKFILRIPIYPNYIWEKYGVDWIQLDAPRHLYIFNLKTIEYLCVIYGFNIELVNYDGHPWSIASTEFCLEGGSHDEFSRNVLISETQKRECDIANKNKNGDSVVLLIKKIIN